MEKTRIIFPTLTLAATLCLVGCGGGGNGGGSRTLNGLLLGTDNAPLAGDTAVYDKAGAALTATTDAQGRYRLVVPRSAITGGDTLTFTDPQGHLVASVSVAIRTDAPSTSLTTVAPPDPPAQPF